ncbi:MAG: TlpA disulfide reductase family protein [Anaerolineae bacterium]
MRRLVILLIVISAACAPSTPPTPTPDTALAPDFTATALTGETYTLSGLHPGAGDPEFLGDMVHAVRRRNAALQQIADAYADRLVLLGINLREDAATVAPFVAEHGLRFPILISPDDATLLNYQVVGLPQTLLISPNGEIVYRQFGPVSSRWFSRELDAQICARTNAIYP